MCAERRHKFTPCRCCTVSNKEHSYSLRDTKKKIPWIMDLKNPTCVCVKSVMFIESEWFSLPMLSLCLSLTHCHNLRSELARRVVPRSLPCLSERHSSQSKKLKVTLFSTQTHTLQKACVKGWGETLCSIIKWDEDLFSISLWKKQTVAFIRTACAKDKQSPSPWLTNAELQCFDVPPYKWELSSHRSRSPDVGDIFNKHVLKKE